jgi:ABC-type polysaccharide/polyol phosphate export permease
MGYIAPSLWVFNESGRGLRELVAQQRTLARFVDFLFNLVALFIIVSFISFKPSWALLALPASC